jgi:hypothetical protein
VTTRRQGRVTDDGLRNVHIKSNIYVCYLHVSLTVKGVFKDDFEWEEDLGKITPLEARLWPRRG